MKILGWVALMVTVVATGGCGNLQVVKVAEVPAKMLGSSARLSAERPNKDAILPRAYEVPNRSMLVQQTAGGSVALGLFLGPLLGGAINASNIDRITREMGESGTGSSFYQIDALKEAAAAWGMTPEAAPLGPGVMTLKPYIVLYVPDEKSGIHTMVGVRVESKYDDGGTVQNWSGHYNYVLPTTHPVDALKQQMAPAAFAQLRADMREGYLQIRNEMTRDFAGPAPRRKIAWVDAPVLGLGAPGDIEIGEGGRLALRINVNNYGAGVDKSTPYVLTIFPSKAQYGISNGPVDREVQR